MRIKNGRIFVVLIALCLAFSGCKSAQIAAPTSTATLVPTVILTPTAILSPTATPTLIATLTPTATPTPTASPISLPALKLNPGDFYFGIDGKPSFIFSRNLAGITPNDYSTLISWAHMGGTILVRVGTDNQSMGGSFGYGYTNTGEVLDDWSNNWEHFFDVAEANGIYVLPFFTGWVNWNTSGYNSWANNPFNSANVGPAKDPIELFEKDSPTQTLYLKWFKSVITRWHRAKLFPSTATFVSITSARTASTMSP
jgi:hypothetical protein